MIPVVLVTGFLGSGKTTFLKGFAQKHKDWKMVFLVNELADISVDGRILENTGLPSHSVVGGSLFCQCKASDFVRIMKTSIVELNDQSELDAVVIETSGIANPEAIGKLVQEHGLGERFSIRQIVTIVSPKTVGKLLQNLPVVESQIRHCNTIIINKTDLVSSEQVEGTSAKLRELNPDARIVTTRYCDADVELIPETEAEDNNATLPNGDLTKCSDAPFVSQTLHFDEHSWDKSVLLNKIQSLPAFVLRVKGDIKTTEGDFTIEKTVDGIDATPTDQLTESSLIFIVERENTHQLATLLEAFRTF